MISNGKQLVWNDYQKDIADDNYFYVRSCVRQNFFPGAEVTFLRVMNEALGKNVYENPHHTSCSGIGYHTDVVALDTTMTIVARQFSLMTESGYKNMAASCITSFGIYTEILETWRENPEIETRIREFLWKATKREFEIPQNLAHASDVFYKFRKEIADQAKYKLVNKETGEPLRVVEHIGCHYAKMFPSKGVGGAEYPHVLVGMVEAWSGEVIDYPERRHCCGFGFRQYLIQSNRGFPISNSRKKFESMEAYKPDMIITNCPGCPMFLDRWQYVISEMEGKTYGADNHGIPVFTFEEVAGILLGYDPWDVGLQVHQVATEPILDKIGIAYNKTTKYLGKYGQDLGKPAKPSILQTY